MVKSFKEIKEEDYLDDTTYYYNRWDLFDMKFNDDGSFWTIDENGDEVLITDKNPILCDENNKTKCGKRLEKKEISSRLRV